MNEQLKPQPTMTYEEWFERQCAFGYDIDMTWLEEELEYQRKAHKLGFLFDDDLTIEDYCVGGYTHEDRVRFKTYVHIKRMPPDHFLAAEYPIAYEACRLGLIDGVSFSPSVSRGYGHAECWSTDVGSNRYWIGGDFLLDEGSVYDGMSGIEFMGLATDEMQGLVDALKMAVEEIADATARTLRADYDWHFSEAYYEESVANGWVE